jgi:2-oxoglutarate ferredoxin oxidoreductase subunit delta
LKSKKIIIHKHRCKSCGICVALCPKKVLAQDENERLYVSDPDACIGCKICEQACPDFAIEVEIQNENL